MKLLARYCLLLVIYVTFSAVCSAQEGSAWQRYAGNNEEFSALLPEEPAVSQVARPLIYPEKPRHGRMYGAYSDSTAFVVLSLDNPNRRDALEVFISEFQQYPVFHAGFNFEREVRLSGFKGKQYRVASNSVNGIVQIFLTNERAYIFEVVSEDISKPSVKQFLESITLDGKTKGKDLAGTSQNRDVPKVDLPSASSSGNTANPAAVEDKIYAPKEVTRKAVVVTRPEPQYTEEARKNQIAGTVVLRGVFSSSGKLMKIRAVSGLEHGLTEVAIAAAKQIKFLPAIKDGKFVSQYIQIEYNFNLY